MTTSTLTRTASGIIFGLTLAAATAMALPTSLTGLADRDVVRNPYSLLSGVSGFVLASPNVGVVGPNLGLGVGFAPGLLLGGGGGGIPSSFGFASGGSGGSGAFVGGGFSFPAASSSVNIPTVPPAILPMVSPPSSQTRVTLLALPVNGAVSVPDGGATVMLLGGSLLAVFLVRRRFAKVCSK